MLQEEAHKERAVLSCGDCEMVPVLSRSTAAELSASASYLIVGSRGGLGQSVAHWLVSRGARNIILMSRNAAKSQHTAALAEELRRAGCYNVLPVSCDVASQDDLAHAIHSCAREGLPPIRGVIHAAFAFRDALAHWRVRQCGLPAVSIGLSVVNGVGYVAEASAAEILHKTLMRAGRRVIGEDHVLIALESAILSPRDPQFVVGGSNSGPGLHWDVDGDLGRDVRLLPLKYRQPSDSNQEQHQQQDLGDSLAAKMAACGTREEAIGVVGTVLANMLADMFLVPVQEIDLAQSPSKQGVDSLVAVEVRNMKFSQAAAELSIFSIMQISSLTLLVAKVTNRSAHVEFAAA
ncbi:hypothetical protein PG994_007996 [Apiospora phragmitis]|uniref:Ketoreductase domain-containing protein n=1 Tax=Apiospora phragmitis TaxID=2905665 RepID=A0ABR1URT3_9PEZI